MNIRTTAGHLTAHDKRVISQILTAGGTGAKTPRKTYRIEGSEVFITQTVSEWTGPRAVTYKASFSIADCRQAEPTAAELPLFRKMAEGSAAAELIARANDVNRPRPWPHGFDDYRQRVQHWLEQYGPADLPWPAADQITDAMQREIIPGDYAAALIRFETARNA